jgi:nitrate reductase gamma subunit
MKTTLKVLGALLTYPTADLRAALPEIAAALNDEGALDRAHLQALGALIGEIAGQDPLDAEEAYVGIFDRGRFTSLNLFEHLHGESRDRGPAMVDLKMTYERAGFRLDARQLPDYLPVLLEFLSMRPQAEALEMLSDCAHILRSLGESLRDRGSPYHAVPAALLSLAGEAGLGARREAPAQTEKSIDEEWMDSEVLVGPQARLRRAVHAPSHLKRSTAVTYQQYAHEFLFGLYPYVCLAVFFVGSLVRFDREQYTWRSESSQLLRRGQLRWGSNLFHIGILGIFFGHLGGLLTPMAVWHALGVEASTKQMIAIVAGGGAGFLCLAGLLLLLHRRITEPRIRAITRPADLFVLLLLLGQLLLGLFSLTVSAKHLDGAEMVRLMTWAQHLVTFRGDAALYVVEVALVFKLHLVLGMTIFLVFPFTRLVHIWSGFASVAYVTRAWQVVRSRG